MAMSRSRGSRSLTTLAVDEDLPELIVLQTRQHAQRGRLAAARGTDEHHELAVGDAQVEIVDAGVRPKRLLTCS